MNISLEQYLNDPSLRIRLDAAARRERAETIRRLLFAPLKALLARPRLRPSRMLRRSALAG